MSTGPPRPARLPGAPSPSPPPRSDSPTPPPALRAGLEAQGGPGAWRGGKRAPGPPSPPPLLPQPRPLQLLRPPEAPLAGGRGGAFASMALPRPRRCGAACQLHPAVTSVGERLWGWPLGCPSCPSALRSRASGAAGTPQTPALLPQLPWGAKPRGPALGGPVLPGPSLGPRSVLLEPEERNSLRASVVLPAPRAPARPPRLLIT